MSIRGNAKFVGVLEQVQIYDTSKCRVLGERNDVVPSVDSNASVHPRATTVTLSHQNHADSAVPCRMRVE